MSSILANYLEGRSEDESQMNCQFELLSKRLFTYPLYRMISLDINNDGLDEVVVNSLSGVHVFQARMGVCDPRPMLTVRNSPI